MLPPRPPTDSAPPPSAPGYATTGPGTGGGDAACTPFPLDGMRIRGRGPARATETSPVKSPGARGAKATAKVRLSTAASITGTARPDPVKPAPVTLSSVIVTLSGPLFVSATSRDDEIPTSTSPKASNEGLTVTGSWSLVHEAFWHSTTGV